MVMNNDVDDSKHPLFIDEPPCFVLFCFVFFFTQTANYGSALNPLRLTYVTERQIKAGRHDIAFPCNLFHDSIPGET